jgi:hypothetical protein
MTPLTGKEDEVRFMENGGNAVVNSIFEARLAQSGTVKPSNHADGPTRERFIRDKYERRKYYDPAGYTNVGNPGAVPQSPSSGPEASFASRGTPSDVARQRVASRQAHMRTTESFAAAPAPAPRPAPAPVSAPVVMDLLDFGGSSTTNAPGPPVHDPFAPSGTVSSTPAVDPFAAAPASSWAPPPATVPPPAVPPPAAPPAAPTPVPAKPPSSNLDIMALFNTPPPTTSFSNMNGPSSNNNGSMMMMGMPQQQSQPAQQHQQQPPMMMMMNSQQQFQQLMMNSQQQNNPMMGGMAMNNNMNKQHMPQGQVGVGGMMNMVNPNSGAMGAGGLTPQQQQQMMMINQQRAMMMMNTGVQQQQQQQQQPPQMMGGGGMMNGAMMNGGMNNNFNSMMQGMQHINMNGGAMPGYNNNMGMMGNNMNNFNNNKMASPSNGDDADGGFGSPMGGNAPSTAASDPFSSLGGINAFR